MRIRKCSIPSAMLEGIELSDAYVRFSKFPKKEVERLHGLANPKQKKVAEKPVEEKKQKVSVKTEKKD